jgi:thiamine phosphate synthase YjbQ (UPF0047 family)
MTSVQVPYSVATVLPTLTVMDITNDVAHEVAAAGCHDGIAYVTSAPGPSIVRVNEREAGFFEDLECLLEKLLPLDQRSRERVLQALLGPRTEQIPVRQGRLCLGTYQRVLLFSFGRRPGHEWSVTTLGIRAH